MLFLLCFVVLTLVDLSKSNYIYTYAGNGIYGYSGDDGPAISAEFYVPYAITVSSTGEVYIADSNSNHIRAVSTNGIITTFAGNGTKGYSGDGGPATSVELSIPLGVAVSADGSKVDIADRDNNRIRLVFTSNNTITTFAGNDFSSGSASVSCWTYTSYGAFSGDG